jgi:hypothetical protein
VLNPGSREIYQYILENDWGDFVQEIYNGGWGGLMQYLHPEATGEILIVSGVKGAGIDIGYYYGYTNHDSEAWLTLYVPIVSGYMGLEIDTIEIPPEQPRPPGEVFGKVDIYGKSCTLNIGADDYIILYTRQMGGGSIILNPATGKIIFPKDPFRPTFLQYGEGAGGLYQDIGCFVIDVETSCDIVVRDYLTLGAGGGEGVIDISADHNIYITTAVDGDIYLDPRGVVNFNRHQATNFVLHQWTTSTRPTNPTEGQIGYNTDTKRLEYWNGTTWKEVATL